MASKTTNMELLLGVCNLYQVFNYLDNRITAPALRGDTASTKDRTDGVNLVLIQT